MIGIPLNQVRGHLLAVLFLHLLAFSALAQRDTIQTSISTDAEFLIRDVFLGGGDCFEVFNVQLSGEIGQAGVFSDGDSAVGFDQGIVLSNGNISGIAAPNDAYDFTTTLSTGYGNTNTDPDIDTLSQLEGDVGLTISDVVILEFDFVPTLDSISFDFVFASEEYCEFTLSTFIDLFGFFISGPGIDGPYTNNGINIAVVPNTNEAITARSISPLFNSQYYINNIPPGELGCTFNQPAPAADIFGFDGLTVPLTASASVIPCETYHLKLVVSDRGFDDKLDAAVFLKANSFAAGRTARLSGGVGSQSPNPIEGCSNTSIIFSRGDSVLTDDLVVKYDILSTSTATLNIDYTGLPDSLILPAGVYSDTIDISILADNLPEGTEFFTLKLKNPCDCSQSELTIFIEEPPSLGGTIDGPDFICNGDGVPLLVTPTGGFGDIDYLWSNGDTDSLFNDVPISDQIYQVILTDACNQKDTITHTLAVQNPSGFIEGMDILCDGRPEVSFPIVLTGGNSFTFDVIEDNITTTYSNITVDTFWIPTSGTAVFELDNLSADGCDGIANGSAAIFSVEINTTAQIDSLDCFADQDAIISLTPNGGDGQYTYQWDHDNSINGPVANNLGQGAYPVYINDNQGCLDTITVTVNEPNLLEPVIDTLQLVANCLSGGSLEGSASGGIAPYSFSWSDGSTSSILNNLTAGNYTLTVQDAEGCTFDRSTEILADSIAPNVVLQALDSIDCLVSQVVFDASMSDQGTVYTYQWTDSNNIPIFPPDSLAITVGDQLVYTLSVINTNNGCSAEQSISAIDNTNNPTFTIEADGVIDCGGNSISLFVADSLANWQAEWQDMDGVVLATNTWTYQTLEPATYQVVVTDLNTGCNSTEEFVLTGATEAPALELAEIPDTLNCLVNQVDLAINTSGGSGNYSYEWSGPTGGIISDPMLEDVSVITSGDYSLIVTDQDSNCTDTLISTVIQDVNDPVLISLPDTTLNCLIESIEITASSASSGNLEYEWFDDLGMSISTMNSVTLNTPGTYNVTLTNTSNGCTDSATLSLNNDTSPPSIELATTLDTLDCITETLTIDASVTTGSGNYTYQWNGPAGGINGNDQMEDVDVVLPGNYSIIVTDQENGCVDTLETIVVEDMTAPVFDAIALDTLDCQTEMVDIDASVIDGSGNYNYQWTGPAGGINGSNQQEDVTISIAGSYSLIVLDIENGCSDTLETVVLLDDTAPILDTITSDTLLTCFVNNIDILASSSSDGTLIYEWFNESGSSISQNSSSNLTTTGTYSVILTNTDNGCTDEALVNVSNDTLPPLVQLVTIPDTLDCEVNQVLLDAETTSGSGDYDYQWTGPSGGINGTGETEDINAFEPGDYSLIATDNSNGCTDTLEVMVTEALGTLSLEPLPDTTLTCTVDEVTFTALSPNVGNLVFEWFDADNTSIQNGNMITLTAAGSYTVSVTDIDNNCTQSSIVNISQDTISPVIMPAPYESLDCITNNLELSAEEGPSNQTANWFNEAGMPLNTNQWNQTVVEAGNYQLDVLDSNNGCLSTMSYLVTIDTIAPVADIGLPETITCALDTVDLSSVITSGSGNYTFDWSGPAMGISGPLDQAQTEVVLGGNYQLTITDQANGCTTAVNTTVEIDTIAPELVAIADTLINCYHPSIELQASSLSTGTLTYQWEDANGAVLTTTPSVMIEDAGEYTVILINSENGCEDQLGIVVNNDMMAPNADAGESVFINCNQNDATLTGVAGPNNWTPSWIAPDGSIISTGNWTLTTAEAGNYQLLVTNTNNGCEAVDFASVSLDQSFPVADAGDDLLFDCFDGSALINASNSSVGSDFSYELFDLNGTLVAQSVLPEFSVNIPGSYELVVIDNSNNCQASDNVTISSDAPMITALSTENIPCTGGNIGSIVLDTIEAGVPPYLYSIDGGNSFQVDNGFYALGSGIYDIIVQDANGCETLENVSLIQESGVSVILPEQLELKLGEIITLSPLIDQDTSTLFSFNWTPSDQLDCDKCIDNVFTANESEVVSFTVIDEDGCSDDAIVRIIVDQRVPIYVPNAFSPNGDGFNDRFAIYGDTDQVLDIAQFQIFDRWGASIFTETNLPINDPQSGWDGTWDGKKLNSNVFVYQIEVRLQNGESVLLKGDILLIN